MARAEDAGRLAHAIARRLAGEVGSDFIDLATATTRSVAQGVLGVALIQALLAGIGMLAVGVPAAGVWALLVLVLAIVQLPPILVLGPVIAYVFSANDTVPAVLFTIWAHRGERERYVPKAALSRARPRDSDARDPARCNRGHDARGSDRPLRRCRDTCVGLQALRRVARPGPVRRKARQRGRSVAKAEEEAATTAEAQIRRITRIAGALVAVFLLWYLVGDRYTPSTSMARVSGYVVPIVPEVSGTVASVRVEINQLVAAGDVLVELDSEDYQLQVERAEGRARPGRRDDRRRYRAASRRPRRVSRRPRPSCSRHGAMARGSARSRLGGFRIAVPSRQRRLPKREGRSGSRSRDRRTRGRAQPARKRRLEQPAHPLRGGRPRPGAARPRAHDTAGADRRGSHERARRGRPVREPGQRTDGRSYRPRMSGSRPICGRTRSEGLRPETPPRWCWTLRPAACSGVSSRAPVSVWTGVARPRRESCPRSLNSERLAA